MLECKGWILYTFWVVAFWEYTYMNSIDFYTKKELIHVLKKKTSERVIIASAFLHLLTSLCVNISF